jgi:hypothetical protein
MDACRNVERRDERFHHAGLPEFYGTSTDKRPHHQMALGGLGDDPNIRLNHSTKKRDESLLRKIFFPEQCLRHGAILNRQMHP